MKIKLLAFYFIVTQTCLCAQNSTITFEISNSKLKTTLSKDSLYSLDLHIIFSQDFSGKQVIILDSLKNAAPVLKLKLGKTEDVQTYSDTKDFRIIVDKNKKIQGIKNPALQNFGIRQYGFYISVDGQLSELIKLKNTEVKNILTTEIKNESYAPGHILYDAIYLNELVSHGEINKIHPVLKNKFYDFNKTTYSENQYLKSVIGANYDIDASFHSSKLDLGSIAGSIGGLDVTTIADGFAKFIVKRTKKELSVAFFDKFRKEIKASPDLMSLFPATYRALDLIGDKIYMYEAYIHLLRESFEKDLSTLPSNLPSIIENNKDFFDKHPELKAMLESGFYIASAMQDNQHPGEIIENYPTDILDSLNPNIKAGYQTLQLLSVSLQSENNASNYWAPKEDIKKLYEPGNDQLLKIYLGLLQQRARKINIAFNDSMHIVHPLYKIIDNSYTLGNGLMQYKNYVKNFAVKINLLETKINRLKTISNDSVAFENYFSVTKGSIDLMKYMTKAEELPFFPAQKIKLQKASESYFDLIQSSADLVLDVKRRHYASAIINTVQIIDLSIGIDQAKRSASKKILKYGTFMATMVEAKNSEDVANAIESVALPTGSASIKRQVPFNVALNAYCGLFMGWEQIKGVDGAFSFDKNLYNSYGVTAPIGISISTSFKGMSLSAFGSIVDIGAVTAFRFENDSTETVPKIELKDIISPGIFLSIGIPKTPLSVNMGYQVGPLLRKVNQAANTYQQNYSRVSISLCVDLPLLNFYTVPKRND